MLIKIAPRYPLQPSEITSEGLYADRRRFLKAMGLAAGAIFVWTSATWHKRAAWRKTSTLRPVRLCGTQRTHGHRVFTFCLRISRGKRVTHERLERRVLGDFKMQMITSDGPKPRELTRASIWSPGDAVLSASAISLRIPR
jgi:hypothetical protein